MHTLLVILGLCQGADRATEPLDDAYDSREHCIGEIAHWAQHPYWTREHSCRHQAGDTCWSRSSLIRSEAVNDNFISEKSLSLKEPGGTGRFEFLVTRI